MSDENDAELAALKPLVAQAALESGIQINPYALRLFAKAVRAKGGNSTMPVAELVKFVKQTAAEEPTHVLLAPAKPAANPRERAIADLERTEALAAATHRPAPSREPKFSKGTKQRIHKFGGAMALLDAVNAKEAPAFLNESNVSEGE